MTAHKEFRRLILERLFFAETRRQEQELKRINTENKDLTRTIIDGFLFGGTFYHPKTGALNLPPPGMRKNSLHPSLFAAMSLHVEDLRKISEEQKFIDQTMMHLLASCVSLAEFRNALPECVVAYFPHLAELPRHNPAGYTLKNNPRALRQFERILPTLEFYSVTRMLY